MKRSLLSYWRYLLRLLGLLRVSQEGELQGLDLHEHGIPAYPEYSLHGAAQPQGAPAFTREAYSPAAHSVGSQAAMTSVTGARK